MSKLNHIIKSVLICLMLTNCSIFNEEPLELYNNENFNSSLKIVAEFSENSPIRLDEKTSKDIYMILKGTYKEPLLRGVREYTDYTLLSLEISLDDEKYNLIINKTLDKKISVNYFKYKGDTFQKYYGNGYINPEVFSKIENIIKTQE